MYAVSSLFACVLSLKGKENNLTRPWLSPTASKRLCIGLNCSLVVEREVLLFCECPPSVLSALSTKAGSCGDCMISYTNTELPRSAQHAKTSGRACDQAMPASPHLKIKILRAFKLYQYEIFMPEYIHLFACCECRR